MYSSEKQISQRIVRIMSDLNINQNQLAKLLNVTQPAVSKYLKGRIPPPLILLEISKLCGKSIEWILTGESNHNYNPLIVAEKVQDYKSGKSLQEKMDRVPEEIKIKLEALLDSILVNC